MKFYLYIVKSNKLIIRIHFSFSIVCCKKHCGGFLTFAIKNEFYREHKNDWSLNVVKTSVYNAMYAGHSSISRWGDKILIKI